MAFFLYPFLLLEQIINIRNRLVGADGFNALGQQESNGQNLQVRSVLDLFSCMFNGVGNAEFLDVAGCYLL